MWDLWFICFFYIIVLFIVIMICITISGTTDHDVENMQRNCNNSGLDQETFERIVVIMSDLPPSYDTCVLEPQPPTYSSIYHSHSPSMNS